eukprot:scaffold2.g6894.t1
MASSSALAASPSGVAAAVAACRAKSPLVHCITNFVSMDIMANVLLAAGASPAMAHSIGEVEAFVGISSALLINVGTLSDEWVGAMKLAAAEARRRGTPWVLDPVGCGATPYRTKASNCSFVSKSSDGATARASVKGVDSTAAAGEALAAAQALAAARRGVVAVSGAEDLVTDGTRVLRAANGVPMLQQITASGCSGELTALIAAFVSCFPEQPLEATAAALSYFGVAAELGAGEESGRRGMLLVGLSCDDCAAVQRWLAQMEPGFVCAPCPAAALEAGTLADALGGDAVVAERGWEAAPAWAPPLVLFSGMQGREVLAVIQHWREGTGLEAPLFAAATPSTLPKPLKRLVTDIVRAQPAAAPDAAARRAELAAAAAAGGSGGGGGEGASGSSGGGGGDEQLGSKVRQFTLLGADGKAVTEEMGGEELREALRARVAAKKAEKAKAERREAAKDETDRLREALRGGGAARRGGGGKGGKGGKGGGGGGAREPAHELPFRARNQARLGVEAPARSLPPEQRTRMVQFVISDDAVLKLVGVASAAAAVHFAAAPKHAHEFHYHPVLSVGCSEGSADAKKNALKVAGATMLAGAAMLAYNVSEGEPQF